MRKSFALNKFKSNIPKEDDIIINQNRDETFKKHEKNEDVLMAIKPQMKDGKNLKAYRYMSDQK